MRITKKESEWNKESDWNNVLAGLLASAPGSYMAIDGSDSFPKTLMIVPIIFLLLWCFACCKMHCESLHQHEPFDQDQNQEEASAHEGCITLENLHFIRTFLVTLIVWRIPGALLSLVNSDVSPQSMNVYVPLGYFAALVFIQLAISCDQPDSKDRSSIHGPSAVVVNQPEDQDHLDPTPFLRDSPHVNGKPLPDPIADAV